MVDNDQDKKEYVKAGGTLKVATPAPLDDASMTALATIVAALISRNGSTGKPKDTVDRANEYLAAIKNLKS